MLADNLQSTIETDHPELGQARRWRAVIQRKLAELREFYPNPGALLAGLTRDKWGRAIALEDLEAEPIIRTDPRTGRLRESPSQLEQVMFTVSRILAQKRKAAHLAAAVGADPDTDEPF